MQVDTFIFLTIAHSETDLRGMQMLTFQLFNLCFHFLVIILQCCYSFGHLSQLYSDELLLVFQDRLLSLLEYLRFHC